MTDRPLKLLVLGAHPDDAELTCGGLMTLYRQLGHTVKMIAVTNGASGHHQMSGPPLTARRTAELAASAAIIGAQSEVWNNPDGFLQPSLEVRLQIIRELRTFEPDLVLTHRTNDYHPDHRAVGQAVQDASYMVTVPPVLPDVPILRRDPVVGYLPDRFTKPAPLQGDVTIDTGSVVETVVDMACCHHSQVIEWLTFNRRIENVPTDKAGQRAFVRDWYLSRLRPQADRYRQELIATYGADQGAKVEFAEIFEISEYAAPLDAENRARLFPFLPK